MKMNRVDWRCRTPARPGDRRLVTGLREDHDVAGKAHVPDAEPVPETSSEPYLVRDIELVRSRRTIEQVEVEGFELRFHFGRLDGRNPNGLESTALLFLREADIERLCEAFKAV